MFSLRQRGELKGAPREGCPYSFGGDSGQNSSVKTLQMVTLAGCAAIAGLAWAAFAPTLAVVNGKSVPNGVLVSKGKSYISLEALKQGGAQVTATASQISVNFVPLGGRNQVDAVEGTPGEWLQNESWRIRVESVEPGDNPFGRGPGFVAKIEFRNMSSKTISPFQSGMDKLQVIDDRNQNFHFSQATFKQFFRDVAPGGAITETIAFGDQQGVIAERGVPTKLMLFFRVSGGKKSKNFRVFLTPPPSDR